MTSRPPGRYVFFSHDGYGLGHVRRNVVIARALRSLDPTAAVSIVTGVSTEPAWLDADGMRVVRVPPLLKGSDGAYRPIGMDFGEAIERRRRRFDAVVDDVRPHVVVIDRHPYGIAGELREGLARARRGGASVVLGLRDVLDEAEVIREEIAGAGWDGAPDDIDEVLIYGDAAFCDHRVEYGIPAEPTYCGWVTESVPDATPEAHRLAVAAGGGGDGGHVFRLALGVLERRDGWRGDIVAGPYADLRALATLARKSPAGDRVTLRKEANGCGAVFARARAVLEMAGYNSTFEAFAAGHRPILVPRRSPRREQAIRASRLAALGLADMIEEGADPDDVGPLLDGARRVSGEQLLASGIRLDGARQAGARLNLLASVRSSA